MASLIQRFNSAPSARSWRVTTLVAALVAVQAIAGAMLFGAKPAGAWFGSGSCDMPGGFVSGQKCLASDANGVEVPWKGEIILPAGTTSISDHAFFNQSGSHPIAGNYQLQLVEDNGTCCDVYQTIDYTVDAAGATTPASFPLNAAIIAQASHHAVGTGGLIGYFLYISNGTPLPAGATCQNTVSFTNGAGASLGSGTSKAGELCNNPTPVPNTGALGGHIVDCTSGVAGAEVAPAGTIAAARNGGGFSKPGVANPISYPLVPTGSYTESATPPAGYHFVYDCPSPKGASAGSATAATATVSVPLNGKGEGWFYVVREHGVLVGHIVDCTGGTPGSDVVPAGSLTVAEGSLTKPNPAQWSVDSGTYHMTATAPAGFHLVDCGILPATKVQAQTVVVPANDQGTATFYVAHDTATLAAQIFDCTDSVVGAAHPGTIGVAGPSASTVASPMPMTTVLSGHYVVTAGVTGPFHFVACGTPVQPATNTRTFDIPANGSAVAVYYVTHDTGALSGTIVDCAHPGTAIGGTVSTVVAGTTTALGTTPTTVPTGTYTVTGGMPSGWTAATADCKPGTTTKTVTVTNGGTQAVVFYGNKVVTPPAGGTQGVTTGGGSNPVTTIVAPVQAVIAAVTGQAPASGVKGAATTQPNTGRAEMLGAGLVSLLLVVIGATVLVLNRRRNATV